MKPLFIKKNGTVSKVSGIIMNLIPSYTLAEYNALTHKPLFWVRTDEDYAQIPSEDVSYGSGSVKDALDGLEWKHKSVSLSPTSISTTSTDITVPEIVGAKEVVAIVDLASLYIIGIENKDVYGALASLIGNSNHQLAGDLRINVTTGVVGIRCSLKGSSRQYPTLTDLYYR